MTKPFCLCNYNWNAFPFDPEYCKHKCVVYAWATLRTVYTLVCFGCPVVAVCCWRSCCCCYALNITPNVNSMHSVWITNASHLNKSYRASSVSVWHPHIQWRPPELSKAYQQHHSTFVCEWGDCDGRINRRLYSIVYANRRRFFSSSFNGFGEP